MLCKHGEARVIANLLHIFETILSIMIHQVAEHGNDGNNLKQNKTKIQGTKYPNPLGSPNQIQFQWQKHKKDNDGAKRNEHQYKHQQGKANNGTNLTCRLLPHFIIRIPAWQVAHKHGNTHVAWYQGYGIGNIVHKFNTIGLACCQTHRNGKTRQNKRQV